MALQLNNAQQNTFYDSTSFSYNAGTGAGRVMVVFSATNDATDIMTAATYDGEPMNRIHVNSDVSCSATMFYLENPSEGSNTLAITCSDGDQFGTICTYVSGAANSNAIGAQNTNKGDDDTPIVSITAQSADSLLLANFASDTAWAFTENGNGTEYSEFSVAAVVQAGAYYKASSGVGAQNLSCTAFDDDWAAIALEILPTGTEVSVSESVVVTDSAQADIPITVVKTEPVIVTESINMNLQQQDLEVRLDNITGVRIVNP